MKVGIIGAGSIGLLFAAYLSETCDVTVYTRTQRQAQEIQKNGIILIKDGQKTNKKVNVCQNDQWDGHDDLTIVTVKQYQLEPIVDKLSHFTKEALNILFLQNGMGHLKKLERLKFHNIFVGTVEHGALKENGYMVKHNGEGVTNIALYKGDSAVFSSFFSLAPEGFLFKWNHNYYEMLIHKLIINAVINPLTAILQVQNGKLIENKFYFQVMSDLFSEISDALNLKESDVYFQKVIEICRKTANNRSSMLKDIESHRKTEVDAILGYLLEQARNQDKKVVLIENIYCLVKGKEDELN